MGLRSMTGFGHASAETERLRFGVEIRGVNHRYADLRVRVPDPLAAWEADIRRRVAEVVRRGRVDVTVTLEHAGGSEARPALNRALLSEVLDAARILRDEHQIPGEIDLATLFGVPGLFRAETPPVERVEAERDALLDAVGRALAAFDGERQREGADLGRDLRARTEIVASDLGRLVERARETPGRLRERLDERLRALDATIVLDPGRVAQEAALLAERADVTEETVRLAGHLEALQSLLDGSGSAPVGKRLDVLLQEMHREGNTVCSKAADLEVTRCALAIRVEVERMREQVQNVE